MAGTLIINGKKFAVIPLAEYEQLTGARMPDLPKADRKGCRPARQAVRATVARGIIRKRIAAGLTQRALAAKAGVAPETLSRIESGKHRPQAATFDKIARALGD